MLCAAGMAAMSADASPVGMARPGVPAEQPSHSASTPRGLAVANVPSNQPEGRVWPFRNPVKYFTGAMQTPFGSKSQGAMTNRAMPPVRPQGDFVAPGASAVGAATLSTPSTPELVIAAAQECESQGYVPEARGHYQRALAMWPGNVELLRAAARMEDRQNNLPWAESLYAQAVASNPQHAGALNDLGLCLARQGKLEASVQLLEQAINLKPTEPRYRNNAAIVLVEMRQDQKALAHLAAVHGSAEANYNFGQLLVQRGRSEVAAPYFVAAIEQKPDMQAAHDALAKLQPADPTSTPTPATETPSVATAPAASSEPAPPTATSAGPQQPAAPVGPQFNFPATARSPEPGMSSYVPPNYYAPAGPVTPGVQPVPNPRIGARPQYLPPVTNQPGTMRR
jgi:tetratricopeptide (TPR) repeat protein